MTLAEAGLVFEHWRENPPTHLMMQVVARLLGWKPQEMGPTTPADAIAAPPPGVVVVPSGLDMPVPELDIELMRARNYARLANRSGAL